MERASPILFVAVRANHRSVSARQIKPSLPMSRQSKGRRKKTIDVVAGIALIGVPGDELTLVRVLMTFGAGTECRMIVRQASFLLVTARTVHLEVLTGQGICRREMRLNVESGVLETVHGVARGTIAPVHALQELPVVPVPVTIQAQRVGNRLAEVGVAVARSAIYSRVLPRQPIACPGVVES